MKDCGFDDNDYKRLGKVIKIFCQKCCFVFIHIIRYYNYKYNTVQICQCIPLNTYVYNTDNSHADDRNGVLYEGGEEGEGLDLR